MLNTQVLKDRSLSYISIAVIGIHLLVLLWTGLAFERHPTPKLSQRLLVKTISLNPKTTHTPPQPEAKPVEQSIEKIAATKATTPVHEEVKPTPAKETKPKPPAPAPTTKPKEVKKSEKKKEIPPPKVDKIETKKIETKPKTAVNPKKKELLAKAQENIAKIQSTRLNPMKNTANLEIPKPKSFEIESPGESDLNDREIGYRDELAGRLKLMLRLPEFGEVKIKLTLEKTGRVVKVMVIAAESDLNRKYVEKELPTVSLPPFGNNFSGMSEYTFSITLSNEI